MASWRDTLQKARGDIHASFVIPAVYLTHAAGTPVRVNVRLHKVPIVSQNTGEGWADAGKMLDESNRIVFDATELPTVLGQAYVIFGNSEAYLTGPSRPKRGNYWWVEVSEVSQADLTALLTSVDTTGDEWAGIVE
jgi:hypothetical protein